MRGVIRILLIGLLLSGCSRAYLQEPPWPAPTPIARVDGGADTYQATSLYSDASPLTRAFDDNRARRVGDLLTVVVLEASEASREASTGVSRDSSVSANVETFLGSDLDTGGPNEFFRPEVKAGTANSFQGSGSTKRKDLLRTTVSARVAQVLEDGNLVVEGRREVRVNAETQYLYVRGIARPVDISTNNTITSAALADAQILYGGRGIVSNQQKPGWMYQILDVVWPF